MAKLNSKVCQIFGLLLFLLIGHVAAAAESASFTIRAKDITLQLSADGNIVGAVIGKNQVKRDITGQTSLKGCKPDGKTGIRKTSNSGVEFTKQLVSDGGSRCRLTERFMPAGSSIRWEIEIAGEGAPWSSEIESSLKYPAAGSVKYWTSWGDKNGEKPAKWSDPLEAVPMNDRRFTYGGADHLQADAFSIPIVTIIDENEGLGFSFIQSPEDFAVEMTLAVSKEGQMAYSRSNSRISAARPVRFAMDIVVHQADWRSGLGWMVEKYMKYFEPANPLTHKIGGCAVYSIYEGPIDVQKLMKMGFRFNWKSSCDYVYMGMFLPLTDDNDWTWTNTARKLYGYDANTPRSVHLLNDYSRQMRDMGFYVLNYMNFSELGLNVEQTLNIPARKALKDEELWKDSNDFVYYKLRDALLVREQDDPNDKKGTPYLAWENGVLLDMGVKCYQDFLLDQVRRAAYKLPASSGICIDRTDYLRLYNPRRDDGISWVDGKPKAPLATGWLQIMEKIGDIMHNSGKVIYCNPLYRRIDLYKEIDGYYDEMGQNPASINICSFLALRKPYVAWTTHIDDPTPDEYFQRHLHMGSFVTVPYPLNDHTIRPTDANVDRCFTDYGPLFDALHGKKWVLKANVLKVTGAKANLFEIPGGYIVPVTFGGEKSLASIKLSGLAGQHGKNGFLCEIIRPGSVKWEPLKFIDQNDVISIDVPLRRGCAMVRLSYRN